MIAFRLRPPPAGYANWSLRSLARHVVTLEFVGSLSLEGVRRTLNENGMTNRKIKYEVIPPDADGEFSAAMDDVLDVYAQPYGPYCPVLCLHEQPVHLVKETRTPLPRHVAAFNDPGIVEWPCNRRQLLPGIDVTAPLVR